MKTLKRGAEGADVVKLQNALKEAGYPLTVDGVFGPGTDKVVRKFQKDNGLAAERIVGRAFVFGEVWSERHAKDGQA